MRFVLAPILIAGLLCAAGAGAEDTAVCKQGKKALDVGDHVYAIQFYTLCIDKGQLRTDALVESYVNRGEAYRRNGRLGPALKDFTAAISAKLGVVDAHIGRAATLATAGKHALAIVDYGRAIRYRPDAAALYYNRALSFTANREYDRALRDLDKVLTLDPNFIGAVYYNKGVVYARLRAYDQALRNFDHSLTRRWTLAVAWFERGARFTRAKHYAAAYASLSNAITLRPNFGDAFAFRGLSLEGLGQTAAALADYNASLGFGTTQPWVTKRLEKFRTQR